MAKPKPLIILLGAQMVLVLGAVGFLVARPSRPPPPRQHHAKPTRVQLPRELLRVEKPGGGEQKPADENKEWAQFPGEQPQAATQQPPSQTAGDSEKGRESSPVAKAQEPTPRQFDALVADLVAGNARFVDGVARQRDLVARRQFLGEVERATAVVMTCTDSRVVPELIFDQPLGSFSVVRLPGAQIDDLSARAVEEAASRLHVKAVLVLGHLGCHHVRHALSEAGKKRAAQPTTLIAALGGLLPGMTGDELDEAATTASISFAAKELRRRSKALAASTDVTILRVLYGPKTGEIRWLDAEPEAPTSSPRSARR